MTIYLTRISARDFLRDRGVPIGEKALKDHARRGTGPRYAIINGRAVYVEADLVAWISEQAARPLPPRRNRTSTKNFAGQGEA